MTERRDPVRIAVVGMGWAGSRQTEAAAELGRDVEVVALVDNDPAFLAERAVALGVSRTYSTLEAALEDPDVEAVSICTPHALHPDQAIAAARAGRHILVEKPMAMTVPDATRMIEAADTAGVVLYVAESECYMPFAVQMREIVQSGEPIGEITFASLISGYRATDPRYPGRREWLTLPELGGTGTWYLQGIHAVAALRFVLGEVASVHVHEHRTTTFQRPDLEATMTAFLVLESGLTAYFVQTTETNIPERLRGFHLYGEGGVVIGGRHGGYDQYLTTNDQDAAGTHHAYPDLGFSEYALELEAFARTVRGDEVGPTDGRAERRSLAILEAGIESARIGRPVDLLARFPELAN
jgi:UDP-N-acetyl-2-amino-2-deoxyglucuronate dehydrogenase